MSAVALNPAKKVGARLRLFYVTILSVVLLGCPCCDCVDDYLCKSGGPGGGLMRLFGDRGMEEHRSKLHVLILDGTVLSVSGSASTPQRDQGRLLPLRGFF